MSKTSERLKFYVAAQSDGDRLIGEKYVKIGNPLDLLRSGAPAGGAAAPEMDKAKPETDGAASSAQKAEGSAAVKVSRGFAAPRGSGSTEGAFDAKRVEQLQAAIANGSFRVNADVVAGNFISSNLEALSRTRH